jgi:prepilin-type processing-associated H-X9-DG protein
MNYGWEYNMNAWRHGKQHRADVLFYDGHVATVQPRIPANRNELLKNTVDTVKLFTWLPGEYSLRSSADSYERGEIAFYKSPPRFPKFIEQGWDMPPGYPDELDPNYRTEHHLWQKFPNENTRQ